VVLSGASSSQQKAKKKQKMPMSLYCKKVSKALYKKPLQSYEAPPIKWHHSVLQAAMTQHRQTCHALTPAKQADSQFTYSAGMKD